jgi:hypothetical protein
MGKLRTIDFTQSGAGTQSFTAGALGCGGVVIQDEASNTGTCTITMENSSATRIIPVATFIPGAFTGVDQTYFGFPFCYDVLKITWTGAGDHTMRINLYSDPIVPFGRIPLFSYTTPIAAATGVNIYNSSALGFVRRIFGSVNTNRAFHLSATLKSAGATVAGGIIAFTTTAAGSTEYFPGGLPFEVYGELTLTLTNDDGANPLAPGVNCWGMLDPN